jgi:putative ABC transport system permease protein
MQAIWKKHFPYQQMGYSWDEKELYDRYYPAEDMKMMGMASVVIWVIAVLGLVTYSTEKRYKEIGIRKVMGASVKEVVVTLSWSFLKLLLTDGLIALPLGLLSGTVFMSLFTFHPGLSYGLMGVSLGRVLLVAVGSVGYYTMKAALMNPVESFRSE